MMHRSHDGRLFAAYLGLVAALAALVVGAYAVAVQHGAWGHAVALVIQECSGWLQVTGGITAVTLLALPALVATNAIVHGSLLRRRNRRIVELHLNEAGEVPRVLQAAAGAAGLANRIDIARSPRIDVFAYGLVHPRVIITTGALAVLTAEELSAVLHHEARHVRRRDPARLMCAEIASRALFAFPIVEDLGRQVSVAMEVAADRAAIHAVGQAPLASALVKFLGTPRTLAAPGIALESPADIRIAHVLDPAGFTHDARPTRASVITTAAVIACIAAILTALVLVPAMPMP